MASKSIDDTEAKEPPAKGVRKSKKLLLIGGVALLVLVLVGGAAFFLLANKNSGDAESEEVVKQAPKGPPAYLPIDNLVVNLADPGGEKVAQIGITFEVADTKAIELVKPYMPTIRSAVLLLVSQRTAEELLGIEGKEKLAADILVEASKPFKTSSDASGKNKKDSSKPKKKTSDKAAVKTPDDDSPVRAVLFSSFIVQ